LDEGLSPFTNKPMMDLLLQLQSIENTTIKRGSSLDLVIHKNRRMSEDCGYCPQTARYHTEIEGNDLMSVSQVSTSFAS
jgi:biotin synthase